MCGDFTHRRSAIQPLNHSAASTMTAPAVIKQEASKLCHQQNQELRLLPAIQRIKPEAVGERVKEKTHLRMESALYDIKR